MEMEVLFEAAAAVMACVGGCIDLKTHKIPNRVTVPGMMIGLLLRILFEGAGGFLKGAAGFGIGCIPVFLWLLGGLKAGDVKLYMMTGVLGGWRFCLATEVCSLLLGGVAAFILTIKRKTGMRSLGYLWQYLQYLIFSGGRTGYEGGKESYFCFGWAIGAGALIVFLTQRF